MRVEITEPTPSLQRTSGQLIHLEQRRSSLALEDTPVVLEADEVEVFYGSFRAVRGVSMKIHKNQITAFIGPSGCGKTTGTFSSAGDDRRCSMWNSLPLG